MKTVFRRSPSSYIPNFNTNAVIQVIIVSGICFIIYWGINAIMLLDGGNAAFNHNVAANIALPPLQYYPGKFWTILTYGWVHSGFWELVTNMIWLYTFGSVVQSLVGHRQILPLYIYCLLAGAVVCLLSQFIPAFNFHGSNFLLIGGQAGIMGFAVAAFTLTPKYRYFLGPNLAIPIIWVVGIFIVLEIMSAFTVVPALLLLAGGGLMGYCYIALLRNGYRPGEWIHTTYAIMEKWVTPDEKTIWLKKNRKKNQAMKNRYEPKKGISQQRIDDILDKINQKGYKSLSAEEKDILYRASKESNE